MELSARSMMKPPRELQRDDYRLKKSIRRAVGNESEDDR
jgi:hypothetical protein